MGKSTKAENVSVQASKLAAKGVNGVFHWIPKHIYLSGGIFLVFAIFYLLQSASKGDNLGNAIGEKVGWAVGSYNGVTKGWGEGQKAGKEAGLSAEDTAGRISTKMQETRRLQVLQVEMLLTDLYQQGEDYAALYSIEGTGEFTVDLAQATVWQEGTDHQIIIIPRPEYTPYLDDTTLKMIAEYPPGGSYKGNAHDGYTGYFNSYEMLKEKIKTEMLGYDTLMEQAETAALEQVKLLAESVCGNDVNIEVSFQEAGE